MLSPAAMEIIDLNFKPQNPCPPQLPTFLWQGVRLNNWHLDKSNNDFQTANYQGEFGDIFWHLYRDISFIELFRVFDLVQKLNLKKINLKSLFTKYNYHLNEELIEDLNLIAKLPVEFLNWGELKKIQPGDLLPLRALDNVNPLKNWLSQFPRLRLTRSEGAKLVELITDLHLTEKLSQLTIPVEINAEFWTKINQLRFPASAQKQIELEQKIKALPWTKDFSLRVERRGDVLGTEVKFFVRNKADLKGKLESQERVLQTWVEQND